MISSARERCTAKADARTLPLFVPILSLGVCGSWEESSVSSRCVREGGRKGMGEERVCVCVCLCVCVCGGGSV
jgi:hypothetical protein